MLKGIPPDKASHGLQIILFLCACITVSLLSTSLLAVDTQLSPPSTLKHQAVTQKGNMKQRMQSQSAEMKHDHDMPMPTADNSMATSPEHADMNMNHSEQETEQKSKPLFWESSTNSVHTETHDQHKEHNHASGFTPDNHPVSIFEPVKHAMPTIAGDNSNSNLEGKYVCPMHPQIVQNKPGNCPICGMNLVAHKLQRVDEKNPKVFLSAAVIQNMGVRIAPVKMNQLHNHVVTQGLVTADEDRVVNIHPRTAGWIEKLYLLTEGDRVERKDEMVDFYSPWINEIQLEFIAALEEYDMLSFDPDKAQEVNARVDNLINSLRLLNVMDMDIMRIKNTRKVQTTIQLLAPKSGVITNLNIREGTYLEPYQPMFTIVDLSRVWVMIDIYEHQAVSVRKGQQVSITTPAIPSRKWDADIDYIYPEVNPLTRTLKARVSVENPDEALLLNMYVNVDISVNHSDKMALTVPREAVILTGEREVVIKALGNGHFQPVDVKTGLRDNDNIEIVSGLSQEDQIVISGQFLIDSESSLQASFLRLSN